jgi:ATP-dependent helicase HrpA
VQVVFALLQQYHDLTLAMERAGRGSVAVSDIREQLLHLIPQHFLLTTPWEWLQHLPRYLAAMRQRLEKLEAGGPDIADRDMKLTAEVIPYWNNYLHRKNRQAEVGLVDEHLALFRWMIEEYRVHLFAQELGVSMPVSPKRLQKQWEKTQSVVA